VDIVTQKEFIFVYQSNVNRITKLSRQRSVDRKACLGERK